MNRNSNLIKKINPGRPINLLGWGENTKSTALRGHFRSDSYPFLSGVDEHAPISEESGVEKVVYVTKVVHHDFIEVPSP